MASSQNFSPTNGEKALNIVSSKPVQVTSKSVVAGAIGSGLLALAEKASKDPAIIGSVLGVAAMIPVAGWVVIGLAGLIAVAAIAVKKLREQFTGYYLVVRTIDEFSILLQKITKMIHLTQYISATYNFDINVDEILQQLKDIFKKFDEVLKQDANAYHEIESQLNSPTASIHTTLEEVVSAAAKEQAAEHANANPPGTVTAQNGGGWWSDSKMGKWMSKVKFNVTEWQSEFKDDVIKLNIYLTTAMGEFTIILNVFQMDLISRSLDTTKQEKRDIALKSFITKNTLVKDSSEYRSMRIGILLHDLLRLRIDFNFCVQDSIVTNVKDNDVCKDHILDNPPLTNAGITISDFRELLHKSIIILKKKLENDEYGDIRNSVTTDVIEKYTNILANIQTELTNERLSPERQNTLKTLKIGSVDSNKDELTKKLGESKNLELKEGITTRANLPIAKAKEGGGWIDTLKSKITSSSVPVTQGSSEGAGLEYLMAHPYELITDKEIGEFLRSVYDYSKREYNKTTQPVTPANDGGSGGGGGSVAVAVNGAVAVAPAVGNKDGGRKMKRRNNTKKYTKKYATSSSAVKRSKTYKIRI